MGSGGSKTVNNTYLPPGPSLEEQRRNAAAKHETTKALWNDQRATLSAQTTAAEREISESLERAKVLVMQKFHL